MSERTWSAEYRYGFNGQERNSDIDQKATCYDFGMRIYNASLAKFMTMDPDLKFNTSFSPYHYGANNPICFIDINGSNWFYYQAQGSDHVQWHWHSGGRVRITDVDGNEQELASEMEKLVFFEVTGKNEIQAATGAIKVYDQDMVILETTEVGSGYSKADAVEDGVYFMSLGSRNPDATAKDDLSGLNVAFGIQKVGDFTFKTDGSPGYDANESWGHGRIRLRPTNWNVAKFTEDLKINEKDGDRGLYLHGREQQGPIATDGCVADRSEVIFNYFDNGGGSNYKNTTPFVVDRSSGSLNLNGAKNEVELSRMQSRPGGKL